MIPSVVALIALAASLSHPAPNPAPGCEVVGVRAVVVTLADSARALAACGAARDRFGALFRGDVPRVRVVLWGRGGYRAGTDGSEAVLFWPTSEAMVKADAPESVAARVRAEQWGNVLPHEIAHALLAARFFPDGARQAHMYGTPLPDWLDEAVAIWSETARNRRLRLADARRLPVERSRLLRILTTPHPAAADPTLLALRDGMPIPEDVQLRDFYPQAIAVLAFVYEAGGPAAVEELTRRLVEDPASAAAIAGLPGLPGDVTGVLASWRAFLARRD